MTFPKASPKWLGEGGGWDAVTTFGVRILKPEIGEWREVSEEFREAPHVKFWRRGGGGCNRGDVGRKTWDVPPLLLLLLGNKYTITGDHSI